MIQSTVTTEPTQAPPMQWGIAQLVANPSSGCVILTNGIYDSTHGVFEGQVVYEGNLAAHPVGRFRQDWLMDCHQRLPENQTVKLQNV